MKLGMKVSMVRNTTQVEVEVIARRLFSLLTTAYKTEDGKRPTINEIGYGEFSEIGTPFNQIILVCTHKPIPTRHVGYKRIALLDDISIFVSYSFDVRGNIYKLEPSMLTTAATATITKLTYKAATLRGRIRRPTVTTYVEKLISKGRTPPNQEPDFLTNMLEVLRHQISHVRADPDGYSYTSFGGDKVALLYHEFVKNGTNEAHLEIVCTPEFRDYLNSDVFTDAERQALARHFRAMVNQSPFTTIYKAR